MEASMLARFLKVNHVDNRRSVVRRCCAAIALLFVPNLLFAQQPDLALNRPAIASSTEGAYTPAKAVDGQSTTRWSSNFSDPQWIRVDLGSPQQIASIKLVWETASAKDYEIQVSSTGNAPWTTIATKTNMPKGGRIDDITGLTANSRYIRMYGTARTNALYGYSLFAFNVYGPRPGTLQFSTSSTTVTEDSMYAVLTINRVNGSDGSVTVKYATTNGSALAGSDYSTSSGTLTFYTNDNSCAIWVPILTDQNYEKNETFSVILSNPTGGATLGSPANATVTITEPPIPLPGRIQAENYKSGGEGVGYHDLTTGNSGNAYRTDNVDIQPTSDVGGGFNVGWIETGEWLEYDVNVATPCYYKFTARIASGIAGNKTITVSIDGVKDRPINIATAAGWQIWSDVVLGNFSMTAGRHVVRLTMTIGGFNLNYVGVSAGPNFYVDGKAIYDGNGTGYGTQSSPWNSVATVNSYTFNPGDIIYLNRGSTINGELWPKGSGSATAPITIDAYGTGAKPIIDAQGARLTAAIRLQRQDCWTIQNIELRNWDPSETPAERWGILVDDRSMLNKPHNIKICNNTIRKVYASNIQGGPANMYETGGIMVRSTTYNQIDNVLIEGNTLDSIVTHGIFFTNDPGALDAGGTSKGIIIRGNVITHIGGSGIIMKGTGGGVIERNYVYGAGQLGRAGGPEIGTNSVCAIWPVCHVSSVVQYNEVCNTKQWQGDGQGLDADSPTSGISYFQYNYSHDNEGGFFMDCDASQDRQGAQSVVRYNISQNDGFGTFPGVGYKFFHLIRGNAQIYNNTFYNSPVPRNGVKGCFRNLDVTTGRPNTFTNNIFVGDLADWGVSVFINNYYSAALPLPAQESGATGRHSDPQFVNPGSGPFGYKLGRYSPCIDLGVSIFDNGGPVTIDYWGTPLFTGMSNEIGASEHTGRWAFTYSDYDRDGKKDLWAIQKWRTGANKVTVHIMNGADNFQSYRLQTVTALPEADYPDEFFSADYNGDNITDLYCVKPINTASHTVEVHILDGASNFTTLLTPLTTIFAEVDTTCCFAVADFNFDHVPDLYLIKKQNAHLGCTEISIADGATGFKTLLVNAKGTPHPPTNGDYEIVCGDYNIDNIPDLYIIHKRNTASKTTELRILSGADNYQSYLFDGTTGFTEADGRISFLFGDYDSRGRCDLLLINKWNTGTSATQLHVLDGSNNFQTYLLHASTTLHETE
jgi:hypothetical protein